MTELYSPARQSNDHLVFVCELLGLLSVSRVPIIPADLKLALRIAGLQLVPEKSKTTLWPHRSLSKVNNRLWRRTLLVLGALPITSIWLAQVVLIGVLWILFQLGKILRQIPNAVARAWRGEGGQA